MRHETPLRKPFARMVAPRAEDHVSGRWRLIGGALAAGGALLTAVLLAGARFDESVETFTRDVQGIAGLPWYTGSVSTLTNMVWAAVAALAFFAAWLDPAQRRALCALGALVCVLGADDALLLHEAVGPENGVPQELFLVGYAGTALLVTTLFFRGARRDPATAFLMGGVLLALSVGCDVFLYSRFLAEDGAKLLGALVWLTVPILSVQRRPDRGSPATEEGMGGEQPPTV